MMNYYFDLIPKVCISAIFIMTTVCIMSIMLAMTRKVIRALYAPKPCKHVEGKHWDKRKKIEVKKDDDKEKKEA